MSNVFLAISSQRKSSARRMPRSAKAARLSGLPIRLAIALAVAVGALAAAVLGRVTMTDGQGREAATAAVLAQRDVEAYLCRKNDGHLIRIVGPSFETVKGWAEQGIPLKIALRGIDRCCERAQARGGRRLRLIQQERRQRLGAADHGVAGE